MNTQDFWALRWFGLLWKEAVDPVKGKAKMWYRGDISFSQYGRNILSGVMDVKYLGGNTPQKTRMELDEQTRWPHSFAEYGSANPIYAPNTQPVLWCLKAWGDGASGVLPWQTIGSEDCWKTAEQTALFYPSPEGPMPSVRLKAFRQGQQLVEYLHLYQRLRKVERRRMVAWLKDQINLEGKIYKGSSLDAGTRQFDANAAIPLWRATQQIGAAVSAEVCRTGLGKSPCDPVRRFSGKDALPDIGYTAVGPAVPPRQPDCRNLYSQP
jgi:hypothetical protein